MDLRTFILQDSEEEFKCVLCKNYLSFSPISLSSDSQSFCGRCTAPEGTSFVKNTPFEALARNLKFPCRYSSNGCFEELVPKNIPQHEENCPHQDKSCPLAQSTECNWKGPFYTFISHCNEIHADKFLNNGEFEVNLSLSCEDVNLLNYDSKLFIMEKKFDSTDKVLECAVYTYKNDMDSTKYPCHLSVQSGNKSVSLNFSLSSLNQKNFEELCLELNPRKRDICGDVVLSGKIVLGARNDQLEEKPHSEILSFLECAECSDFTMQEFCIPQCSQIILCSNCYSNTHLSECQNCEENDFPRSIEVIDKIATVLNYPCKFHKNGCNYVSKYNKSYEEHLTQCLYRDSTCIYECDWTGCAKDLTGHIYTGHQKTVSQNECGFCPKPERQSRAFCIKHLGKLFEVQLWLGKDKTYIWCVIPLEKVDNGFKLQLELRSDNRNKVKIIREVKVKGITQFVFDVSQLRDFNFTEFKARIFK